MGPWVSSSRQSIFLQTFDSFFDQTARQRNKDGCAKQERGLGPVTVDCMRIHRNAHLAIPRHPLGRPRNAPCVTPCFVSFLPDREP